jgi:acetoacetyl-CoA synthetase
LAEFLWHPSAERVSSSNMTHFSRYVERLLNKPFRSYDELHSWSVQDIEEFWKSIWVMSGIIHSENYRSVLESKSMQESKWFTGAKLNFAENLLRFNDNHIAIISARENSPVVKLTYKELYKKTSSLAMALKKLGVEEGDRAAGFVSNIPEAIIAMLAAASIGAVWTSCSPDFGLQGVLDRFGQIKPKVLFAVEEYSYNGKIIDCREKIKSIRENIPEIANVIIISRFYDFINPPEKTFSLSSSFYFHELMDEEKDTIEFNQLPFDHPVYIMYSSGTTGKPKCIVHGAGGTLLQHYKELALHTNLTRSDTITYFTTCGWMMWNWLVSSLNIGASIFIYDGSPAYPDLNFLWKKIDEQKITIFGTSPKFLSMCEKTYILPKNSFKLDSLKTILSTGAPLSEENFKWVYSKVKEDLQLSSISGGTDIISCFMLGNPNLPVYPGEIQCRGLGMKVEAFNREGKPVVNEKGELVCTAPFPSMPVFFWDDADGEKYKSAYFNYYPGVWRHGDYIKITGKGTIIVYGRSDATLNPGGVRIGTSEVYRIVESMNEISDSLVVGQKWNNDVRIILFVVLSKGLSLNDDLKKKIKDEIKLKATPRHVPSEIFEVQDIPKTLNGKKVELAVSKIINGEEIDNKEALANPGSLKYFYDLPALKQRR